MLRSVANKMRKHVQSVAKEIEYRYDRIGHDELLSICANNAPSELSKFALLLFYL